MKRLIRYFNQIINGRIQEATCERIKRNQKVSEYQPRAGRVSDCDVMTSQPRDNISYAPLGCFIY